MKNRNQSRSRNLGTMVLGGNPKLGRVKDDKYYTPPEVVRALLQYERFDGQIWDPAYGSGNVVRALRREGYETFGTKHDFVDPEGRVCGDNIITNPPFVIADQFIRRGVSLIRDGKIRKMALLLKSGYWHAASRIQLWRSCQPSIIRALTWRVDFCKLGSPVMEVVWSVWDSEKLDWDTCEYGIIERPPERK